MKKMLIIGCSVALISLGTANAQDQDSASMNYNDQTGAGVTKDDMGTDDRDKNATNRAREKDRDTNTPDEGRRTSKGDAIKQGSSSADKELEDDVEKMKDAWRSSTVGAKVGPNGEKLFMEKGKYYYYNEKGKKVKVKKSEVRDNPDN